MFILYLYQVFNFLTIKSQQVYKLVFFSLSLFLIFRVLFLFVYF